MGHDGLHMEAYSTLSVRQQLRRGGRWCDKVCEGYALGRFANYSIISVASGRPTIRQGGERRGGSEGGERVCAYTYAGAGAGVVGGGGVTKGDVVRLVVEDGRAGHGNPQPSSFTSQEPWAEGRRALYPRLRLRLRLRVCVRLRLRLGG
jgi:hypothetical protein